MRRALRVCMVALVAASLAFVQVTEAARWIWLGPLLGLTLAAPWLLRLTRFMACRLLWNLAVLGAFALLVRHVTYAGAAYLLEDGLLLAALCQVHLVNNLSDTQKPDLLFFNSFLIAVVTSFLSVDLRYSAVLLAYAPLLVVSMQLLSLARAGVAETPGLVARAVKSGLLRGAGVLVVTLVVFLVVPRDFSRRGLLGETLGLKPPAALEVAFSDRIDLAQSGQVQVSNRIVMTVRSPDGIPPPPYWRGAALDRFDGQGWRAARGVLQDSPWCEAGKGVWTRPLPSAHRSLDVYLVDPSAPRLFTPLDARRLEVASADVETAPQPDGTFRRVLTGQRRPVQYAVEMAEPRSPGGPRRRGNSVHVALAPRLVPRGAYEILKELKRGLAPGAPQHLVVERLCNGLSARFPYVAPGAEGGARSLAEFLEGKAGGHCEYFATALAILLRIERIPCRVVTGYRSEELSAESSTLTIRARHAHAWVEVLDPEAGWMTADPTPAGPGNAVEATGFLAWSGRAASRLWSAIAGFNAEARDVVFAWIAGLPGRIAEHPGSVALLAVALALVLAAARLRRRRRGEPHGRAYRRVLRRLNLEIAATETPRELLARARRTAYPAEGLRELEVATAAHEQARYVV